MQAYERKDLSPKAIRKEVNKKAIGHPFASYPLAASVLGGVYLLLFGVSSFLIASVAALGVFGFGKWFYDSVINSDVSANKIVREYHRSLLAKRRHGVDELRSVLSELSDGEGLVQLDLFGSKYESLVEVLERKLVKGELAYNRYLSIAEQVYLGGLDNLENASVLLQSVSAIDIERLNRELEKLDHGGKDQVKANALFERISLWRSAHDQAKAIKLQNEIALTNLDKVSAKIAQVNTGSGKAYVALEDSMEELKRLIAQADRLSNK